jgi:hypothetical protein
MFPVRHTDNRLPPKNMVYGLQVRGEAKAFPMKVLERRRHVEDEIGGLAVRIDARGSGRVSAVTADAGKPLAGVVVYWFAWATFHPGSAIWEDQLDARPPTHSPWKEADDDENHE